MSQSKELTKKLPRSGEGVEINIKVSGDDGETVTVEISRPDVDLSKQTVEEYNDHRWGRNRFWYEVMEDAFADSEYEIKANTYRSNSGNISFRGGVIEFDYYEEARIDEVVETVLHQIDEKIVLENRKRSTEEEKSDAAQALVTEDVTDELDRLMLAVDDE